MEIKNAINIMKEYTIKFLNSPLFAVLIGFIIFLKTLMFYNNTIAVSDPIETQTLLGTIFFILLIIVILEMLPNKPRIITAIVINVFISILLFADNVYYIFSNNLLSVAQITNLQYTEQIMSTIPSLIEFSQILYFIDIIIIVTLFILKFFKITKKPNEENAKKEIIIKYTILGVLTVALIIITSTYIEKGNLKSYNKDLQLSESTIYGYHVADIYNALNSKSQAKYKDYDSMINDYDNLKEQYEEKYGDINYELGGILEGTNIIVLQLESVQEFVVNKTINDQEITPNLNRFLQENIEFTNMHMQSYSTTADSEFTTIASLYPMENGMSFSKYYTNTYDDIFKIFNNHNYNTSFMHGNYPYFWNRGNVYGRLNLNDLIFKDNFEDISENINGDLSDELLYKQAVQKLKQNDKPFFSNIVAASSHTPFTLDGIINKNEKIKIDVGKYKDTYFGNYLESMNYADYAFGIFIEELEKNNLYDDTALLVFGDHNGLTMYNEELIDFLKYLNPDINDVDIKLNYTRVLAGLKLPGIRNIQIDKPVSKLDIKPTLAYLANVEDGLSLGTNMLASKDFVCLNNERIITDKYYYDEQWYDRQTGKIIDMQEISEEERQILDEYYNNMKTELDISNSININDLLR